MKTENWENTGFTKEEKAGKITFIHEETGYNFDSIQANKEIPEDIPLDKKIKIKISYYQTKVLGKN